MQIQIMIHKIEDDVAEIWIADSRNTEGIFKIDLPLLHPYTFDPETLYHDIKE